MKSFVEMPQNVITRFTFNGTRNQNQLLALLDQKVINKFVIIILSYKGPFVIIADSDFAAFRLNNGSHYI